MIVLIIEDETPLSNLWERFLKEYSQEIRIAHSPKLGLELMRQLPFPNIVLLDLGFPDSSPYETLTSVIPEIKSINPEATIVIMTGNTEGSIMELSEQLGAAYFAQKPQHASSQNSLLAAIKAGLENVTQREPSFSQPLRLLEFLNQHLLPKL